MTQETCVLRAHEAPKEVQDIFKRVAGGKLLGPHVSRKANCRAQVISKDLEVLFFGSPVFRDGSFFATREVYKNRMRRRKKKKNREEEGASKKTLIRKGFRITHVVALHKSNHHPSQSRKSTTMTLL